MQDVVDHELRRLGGRLAKLTGGAITSVTQTGRIVDYLKKQKVQIDSLDKRYLPLVLNDPKNPLTDDQRAILALYQEGNKSSTAKLARMQSYQDDDGRVRCLVQYGGAMRTLRWAGRGVQIQNYPRPTKAIDSRAALEHILCGADADELDFIHGAPMDVVSQCLRGAYVAADGRMLAVCDYSAIEARVVAWLAGQADILDVFRRGEDIYVKAARDVGSSNRLLGKVIILACGFGMGWRRFREMAAAFGITLSEKQAKDIVYGWRDVNSDTRSLWRNVDDIVRTVIEENVVDRWTWTDSKKLAFRMARDERLAGAMLMQLPSGRSIVYREARVDEIINDTDDDGVGEVERVIRYDGLDWRKKWTRIRTWGGKLVENATQAMARDLLADAMLRLDDDSDDLDVTVHDELIAEPEIEYAHARLAEMKAVMSAPPSWASGLPLAAEGALMTRYGK
jgi:DNA polymerase